MIADNITAQTFKKSASSACNGGLLISMGIGKTIKSNEHWA